MNEVTLQSTVKEGEVTYHIPDFGKVTIGRGNVDFWRQFQALPTLTKIHMLNIEEKDVEQWLSQRRTYLSHEIIKRIQHKGWKYCETGEPVDMDDFINYSLDIPLGRMKYVGAIKKNKYTIAEMEAALTYFDSRIEVYNEAFDK